ncbi:MAG TPA: DUF1569 domain-containing protein [Longimicrobiales bacterium]|nr:DUF1569 domain-containing protein [Longimicrobiales bacterium]
MSLSTTRRVELDRIRDDVARWFAGLPMPRGGIRPASGWAPLDDLRHLTLSVAGTTRGFRLEGSELDERFGPASPPGRSRDALARLALEGLRSGGVATEAITPAPLAEADATEATRDRCVAEWRRACDAFREAVAVWPEAELDLHRFPHPFLGILTLREWIDFHVLHARHHVRVATRRLERS